MKKYEKQFRKYNPQTIGETDQYFDLETYKLWLESTIERLVYALDQINMSVKFYCRGEKEPTEYFELEIQMADEALNVIEDPK